MPGTTYKRGLAVLAAGALTIPLFTGVAEAAPARHTVASAKPDWTATSAVTGTPSSSERISIRVGLQLRGGGAAQSAADQVSNPASSSYGKYLSSAQFQASFAPSAASVNRVKNFLASSGIKVTSVAAGNLWVNASGTASQLDKAFGTTLRTYSVSGQQLRGPAGTVSIPSSIAADVTTVSGLADHATVHAPQTRRVPASYGPRATAAAPTATRPPASQCSDYWGEYTQTVPKAYGKTKFNTYICGYSPSTLRTAYGTKSLVKNGTDGQGVNVAIIDAYASPTMLADANDYAGTFGEPRFTSGQYTETVFTPFNKQDVCAGEAGWNSEETLDVEALHGMAPGANIHYIGAQNCDDGIDAALNYVVQNHTADIVSNSYGNTGEQVPADEVALEHAIFVQAAAEGIGMYFSSGDSGDEVINGLTPQPDYSASDPNVTAVGGTSLLLDKHNNRVAETGWETALDTIDYSGTKAVYSDALPGDFVFGAGGGTSTLFSQPYYQKGTVPAGLASPSGGQPMRVVPDIAADADPYTGFYIGETVDGAFGISEIGGTSLACPLIAGIQAVASQDRRFPIGFANPLLYSMGKSAFGDVVPRTPLHFASVGGSYLGTFEAGDTQYSRYGYDNITGRGTPNGATFIKGEATH
ncbi:MAG: S53 family peptidase [Actinomycetota bacterium]|nr:S53 family peptidase [Actinomycetota bacterium]